MSLLKINSLLFQALKNYLLSLSLIFEHMYFFVSQIFMQKVFFSYTNKKMTCVKAFLEGASELNDNIKFIFSKR